MSIAIDRLLGYFRDGSSGFSGFFSRSFLALACIRIPKALEAEQLLSSLRLRY